MPLHFCVIQCNILVEINIHNVNEVVLPKLHEVLVVCIILDL